LAVTHVVVAGRLHVRPGPVANEVEPERPASPGTFRTPLNRGVADDREPGRVEGRRELTKPGGNVLSNRLGQVRQLALPFLYTPPPCLALVRRALTGVPSLLHLSLEFRQLGGKLVVPPPLFGGHGPLVTHLHHAPEECPPRIAPFLQPVGVDQLRRVVV